MSVAPWIVNAVYAVLAFKHYSTYLDFNLAYVPKFVGTREDVLGFGFFPTWLFFFAPWLIAQAVALRVIGNKELIASVTAFLAITGTDYWLYSILLSQLPSRIGG